MKNTSDKQPSPGGWVILGLLLDSPKSGYDLSAIAQRSVGQFWPLTKAHIYGELPKLERLSYVEGQEVPQQGVPDKKIYTATKEGREAFSDWLASPSIGEPLLRHPLLVQVFFGAHLPPGRLKELVDVYRQSVIKTHSQYSAILNHALKGSSSGSASDPVSMRRLAVRHALIRIEAELVWLNEVDLVAIATD
ncbi:DNA-binding PadR family transcriptional regulator [Undibacterium sp. GrIS 1.8]|uniref:PadR family transcriptional regulator n=1 Tax=Undibacterium sp. GrIS 1.8 TaxID=3143934 RepID=UPI003391761A